MDRWTAWYNEHRGAVTAGVIGVVALLLVVVAVMVAALLEQPTGSGVADASQSATAAASESPAPSRYGSPQPSASASSAAGTPSPEASDASPPDIPPADPNAGAEGWTEVAQFGEPGTIETVLDVADTPYGVLAVGVRIGTRNMPVFGPVPQEGRVWWSDDGRSWQDVTPAGTFADASIQQVVALPDAAVIAFGTVSKLEEGIPEDAYAAWETRDGRTWTGVEIGMDGEPITGVAHGGRGYVSVRGATEGSPELWHSTDGRSFSRSFALPPASAVMSLTGGPEGFVAVVADTTAEYAAKVFASGDGVEWYEAEEDLADVRGVAALGPDWVAVAAGPFEDYSVDAETPAWFSSNGLEWTEVGAIPLIAVPLDETMSCREFLSSPVGTGDNVVVSTTISYPCGEGRVQNFGRSSISTDGATWARLPFTESRVATDGTTRGGSVHSGVELEAGTLLVGEKDYRAGFWWLPADR